MKEKKIGNYQMYSDNKMAPWKEKPNSMLTKSLCLLEGQEWGKGNGRNYKLINFLIFLSWDVMDTI